MFHSRIRKNRIAQFSLNRIKDALIMITVGVIGSNLLLIATGGLPLFETAEAASDTYAHAAVQVSNLNFDLNPSNPTMVSQVQIRVNVPDGSTPTSVAIGFDNTEQTSFKCYIQDGSGLWTCDVSNVEVGDLNQYSVLAY
ncbi:MAG: hypothetical protein KAR65_07170 [Anaerolineales bacterium]|nr:hypothetical protein [Anaerolineales bacterium]MCK5633825.1 hypothetical protein [Anaerolineales bacterium]